RFLEICDDVGLLAEEYVSENGHFLGTFPKVLSRLALVGTAYIYTIFTVTLASAEKPGVKIEANGARCAAETSACAVRDAIPHQARQRSAAHPADRGRSPGLHQSWPPLVTHCGKLDGNYAAGTLVRLNGKRL